MATLSIDLRERILVSYDRGEQTREQVARRFYVSLGMVKKLLQQRRHTGDIAPRHHRSGRKPLILASHRQAMGRLLRERPDMTLAELRAALGLDCSLPAIHYALDGLGLTYKKRRSAPASRTGRMSVAPGGHGGAGRGASTRRGSSSSTSRGRKRT